MATNITDVASKKWALSTVKFWKVLLSKSRSWLATIKTETQNKFEQPNNDEKSCICFFTILLYNDWFFSASYS